MKNRFTSIGEIIEAFQPKEEIDDVWLNEIYNTQRDRFMKELSEIPLFKILEDLPNVERKERDEG